MPAEILIDTASMSRRRQGRRGAAAGLSRDHTGSTTAEGFVMLTDTATPALGCDTRDGACRHAGKSAAP